MKHPGLPPLLPQGRLLNAQAQHPDEFLSAPAFTVSGWAFFPTPNGDMRLAFCEQVFNDGKTHSRGAILLSQENFLKFVDAIVKVKGAITTEAANNGKQDS